MLTVNNVKVSTAPYSNILAKHTDNNETAHPSPSHQQRTDNNQNRTTNLFILLSTHTPRIHSIDSHTFTLLIVLNRVQRERISFSLPSVGCSPTKITNADDERQSKRINLPSLHIMPVQWERAAWSSSRVQMDNIDRKSVV